MTRYFLLVIFMCFISTFAICQVGIGTNNPDSSAMLEVKSSDKGFLPPRVALQAANIASPVTTPALGLLVFNTTVAGSGANAVAPGYYYWNGTMWYAVVNVAQNAGDMQYWNGTKWVAIPVGADNSALILCGTVPTWGGCPEKTLTLSPAGNINEAIPNSYNINSSGAGDTQLTLGVWTIGGNPIVYRPYVKFDYTLPPGATIISAKLSWFSMPNPKGGNQIDAQTGTANDFSIYRVTSSWAVNTINWNTQPTIATTNKVNVPVSTSPAQNSLDLIVTQLVKDMQANANNGFALRLNTENYYNLRQFASSFNSDASKRPKLVIVYR